MPVQITCPTCRGPLRVPEELFGKRVQCPTCEAIFIAEVEEAAPDGDRPTAVNPTRYADNDPLPRRREYRPSSGHFLQPHRGGLVLGLGIASLVVCAPLGIAAWVMGNNDLAAMRRGEMDRTGEGNTQAGRICGMVASILMLFGCGCYAIGMIFAAAGGNF